MCCLISDKSQSGSDWETSYAISFAVVVNPLAKGLDIVEDNIKDSIFVNVAVEILIATLVGNQRLVSFWRNLKLLNRRGFDGVTCSRNEEHV